MMYHQAPAKQRWTARVPPCLVHAIPLAIALAALFLATGLFEPYRTFQLATACALYCAVAGLSVLTGLTGQVSLGHGALMAVGGYAAALMMQELVGKGTLPALVAGLLAATMTATVAGWALGLGAARLEGPYLAGVTLALVVAVPAVVTIFGETFHGENGLALPALPVPDPVAGSVALERWQTMVALACAFLVTLLLVNLSRSHVGRAWRAGRDNAVATSLAGVDVGRMRVVAFTVSAGCAGLGGGVLAFLNGQVSPGAFGLALSIQLLTAMVLGGLGSLTGAAMGSVLIVWLPDYLSTTIAGWSLEPATAQRVEGNLPLALYGAVLILVMLLAPHGLTGMLARAGRWLVGSVTTARRGTAG